MIDLISRQAAIDAANKVIERDTSGNNDVVNAMIAWSAYIKSLPSVKPQPCEDAVSRQAVLDTIARVGLWKKDTKEVHTVSECLREVEKLPPVNPQERIGHCKDCKCFGYDIVEKRNFCKRWGGGIFRCKTKEDGYCFLFETKESEDKE